MTVQANHFQALLSRVRQGSEGAAWELVEHYGSHVRAVVRRRMHPELRGFLDSADFVQSVWGSLFRMGPRLNTIERPEELVALLAQMASNKVIDEVRRRTRTAKNQAAAHVTGAALDGGQSVTQRHTPATPSQVAIARERWDRWLAEEPPLCKQMLQLRLAGSTYLEIAEKLGISERTVRRTIARLVERDEAERN